MRFVDVESYAKKNEYYTCPQKYHFVISNEFIGIYRSTNIMMKLSRLFHSISFFWPICCLFGEASVRSVTKQVQ